MSLEIGSFNDAEIELLAKETGLSITEIKKAQEAYIQSLVISLETPITTYPEESNDTYLLDLLKSEELNPEEMAIISERKSKLLKIMGEILKGRDYQVIILRFGFENGSPMTLEEVGHIYGVTRERIRQIEKKALKRLRRRLNKDGKNSWIMD